MNISFYNLILSSPKPSHRVVQWVCQNGGGGCLGQEIQIIQIRPVVQSFSGRVGTSAAVVVQKLKKIRIRPVKQFNLCPAFS